MSWPRILFPPLFFGLPARWGLACSRVFICSLNSALTIKSLSSNQTAPFVFCNTEGNMLRENPLLLFWSAFNLTKASCRHDCCAVFFKSARLLSPAVEQRFVDCAVRTPVKSNANLSPRTSQMALVFFPHSPVFSFAGLGNLSEVFHHLAMAVWD